MELGRTIHVESRYGWMVYSANRTWNYLKSILASKQHCVMMAVREEQVVALLAASAQQYPFGNDFAAQIEVFYVVPALRGGPIAMSMLGALPQGVPTLLVRKPPVANERTRRLEPNAELLLFNCVSPEWLAARWN